MVTREGRLKITDFGVARIEDAPLRERGVIGSPGYLAPECYQREAVVDQRADLYACGVLLFELLTGTRPFRGSPDVVKVKTLHLPVPLLANPGDAQFVPLARFAHVVQRALAKAPDERYASAREMREALTLAAARPVPQALSAPALRLLLGALQAADKPGTTAAAPRRSLPPPGAVLPILDQVLSVAPLPPSLLRDALRVTAQQMGPLATLLVKRAAAQARTPQQFIARLAQLAAEGRDREVLYAALRPLCS
jgi:serine/threonine-protein kinase